MQFARSSFALSSDLPHRARPALALPVWAFLIAVFLPVAFRIGALHLTGVRLVLIILILPLAFNLLRGLYGRLLATDILFGLHFCWIIFAMVVNSPELALQNAGATGVELLGGYLVGRAYVRTAADMIALIRAFILLVISCVPLAVFEGVSGHAVLLILADQIPGLIPSVDLAIPRRLGLERAQMAFEHPIHWGLVCALGVSLCQIGLGNEVDLKRRLAATGVICLGGVTALSSGALLAIALQLGLVLWAASFRQSEHRWWLLIGFCLLAIGLVDLLSTRSSLQVFMSYATFSAHSAYWRSTIFDWGMVNIWANPLFGLGLRDWVRPVWMHRPSVDNFWLLTTMRFGLPAFIFLAAGYLTAIWRIARREIRQGKTEWFLRRAWVFCFVAVTFALTTVHIWGAVFALVFFVFGAGMWMISPDSGISRRPEPPIFSRFSASLRS